VKVMVRYEYFEREERHGIPHETHHKPGEMLDVDPEYFEVYDFFLKPLKERKTVNKGR